MNDVLLNMLDLIQTMLEHNSDNINWKIVYDPETKTYTIRLRGVQ